MSITTLQGFGESLKDPGQFTYSQLIDKFESFMPDGNEGLVQRVFTRLLRLEGSDDRIETITNRLHAWADATVKTIPLANHQVLSAILPVLIKEDPAAAATLIHGNDHARAVAMKLTGDESGNSLFALAEGIYDWEAATGHKFDKRFTLWEHLYGYREIFQQHLADWGASPAVADLLNKARCDSNADKDVVLDLRGFKTIPRALGMIARLRGLLVDEGVVLPRLPRKMELNLIVGNPSIFQNIRTSLKEDESFIIAALKRNGALLKYLPMRGDKEFLLRVVEEAPGIIAYIDSGDSELMLSLVKKAAFGQEAWEKHFGPIGEVPPLPVDILEILNRVDPFNPDKKVVETHMLFFLPAGFNLYNYVDLFKKSVDFKVNFNIIILYGFKSPAEGQWILMTKDVIPNSRNKRYEVQQSAVEGEGYLVPDLLSAVVGILTHFVRSGERLFSDMPLTYTRCIERLVNKEIVVGYFCADGFKLDTTVHHSETINTVGIAACRKFST